MMRFLPWYFARTPSDLFVPSCTTEIHLETKKHKLLILIGKYDIENV